MDILTNFNDFNYPSVITIGNFDGCHLGHKLLINSTINLAKQKNIHSMIFTFDPGPANFLQKDKSPLYSLNQKLQSFKELGIDSVYVQKFTKEFSLKSHKDFYENIIKKSLHAKAIVIGEDFRFGKDALGDIKYLNQQSSLDGSDLIVFQKLKNNNIIISSTNIRKAVLSGDALLAEKLLGHPYLLEGVIIKGFQKGRTLGYPTINLNTFNKTIIDFGVYWGYVYLEEKTKDYVPTYISLPEDAVPAVFHIGKRRTIIPDNNETAIEAHLLQGTYDESTYGARACFYFKEKLRDVIKFKDKNDLKNAISKDVEKAKNILRFNR